MVALVAMACNMPEDHIKKSKEVQQRVQQTATEAVPPYQPTEFSIRKDINWYLQETEGSHTWYVYALNMLGEPMFYIVSDVPPTNVCVNVTSAETIDSTWGVVLTAPSLNGVYRKSGACNTYFMRDVSTGSVIKLSGTTFTLIASKQPLAIETDLLGSVPEGE